MLYDGIDPIISNTTIVATKLSDHRAPNFQVNYTTLQSGETK